MPAPAGYGMTVMYGKRIRITGKTDFFRFDGLFGSKAVKGIQSIFKVCTEHCLIPQIIVWGAY